jgi:SHS family lactate transporter-like MFS transporter
MNTATFEAASGIATRRSAALTVFVIGLAAWTLTNMDQSLFGYALPGILTEFRRGPETAGLILSISFVAAAVMVVVAGMAADRYGRAVVLVTLLAGSAVFVGLLGWTATLSTLIVLRVFGFGLSAGLSPVINAMVIENAPARLRAMAMGLLQCGYPLGWFVASLLAAPLLASSGWRAACFAAFLVVPIALVMGVLLRRRLPQPTAVATAATGERGASLRTLLQPRYRVHFWASFATFFLFGGAYAGSAFFFPTFFTSVRGYSESDAALLVGLSNGVAVIGYLSAAALGEYVLSRRNVFSLWCLLGAGALLVLLWSSGGREADYLWFALMAIFFYGAMAVLPLLVAEIFPPELRATALGACASAPLSLGFALFPLIVPAVIGHLGWVWALTIVVAPALTLAALTALALPSLRSSTLRG